MKKLFLLGAALLLSAGTASAATTTQKWTPGFDNLTAGLQTQQDHVVGISGTQIERDV